MKKVRLIDIAEAARVGIATVERVLNARGNVAPATVERVLRTARRLGYDRALPEKYRGLTRIEVVMVRPEAPFYSRLNAAFVRMAAALDPGIVVHRTFLDEGDPRAFARHIADPGFRRSALIVVAPDHPEVTRRLVEARAAGVAVVSIVSDLGVPEGNAPITFVGIDNHAAGRTAAYFMARMLRQRPGSLLAICHSGDYRAHRERIQGFADGLKTHAGPPLTSVLFGRDNADWAAEALETALCEWPATIGLYSAGGGNDGVAAMLERRPAADRLMWIGHELTAETRRWLQAGTMDIVLDQAPEVQARRALDMVLRQTGFIDVDVSTEPVRFLTLVAENI
jgi:LacI family transcriptional regulator